MGKYEPKNIIEKFNTLNLKLIPKNIFYTHKGRKFKICA